MPARSTFACLLVAFGCGLGFSDAAQTSDDLVGSWSWTWTDAAGVVHKHVLEVEGSGDKLSAREKFDDLEPVKVTDLKLTGKKVSFSVGRDKRQAAYSGTLKSKELIEGQVIVTTNGQTNEFGWEARRQTPKKP